MRYSNLFLVLFRFLIPPALIGTLYLYLYPAVHGCGFPEARRAEAACYLDGANKAGVPAEIAPFRLLALGDPQLEGDTSLPDPRRRAFPSLEGWGIDGRGLVRDDLPRLLRGYRKRLDLWGNDYFLAHIYRLVYWWTRPTHTVVLGDLLGSQWIDDEEFRRRSDRFWGRVFRNGRMVPREVTDVSGKTEVLNQDERWKRRVIAVAGNHDIGYAGDVNEHRVERFEERYGRVNWDIRFRLNVTDTDASRGRPPFSHPGGSNPELHLVVLNSMNLDRPGLSDTLREESHEFFHQRGVPSPYDRGDKATILLTHIPLHKEAGLCVDAPFFSYFPDHQGGGIQEQNHLSEDTSRSILNGLVGVTEGQSPAIILTGHDHEGCDTYHHYQTKDDPELVTEDPMPHEPTPAWNATRYPTSQGLRSDAAVHGLREITVRSMMGSFGGNAGLLSAWYEPGDGGDGVVGEWRFEYATCVLGVQHVWWAVHVLDLVVAGLGLAGLAAMVLEEVGERKGERGKAKQA